MKRSIFFTMLLLGVCASVVWAQPPRQGRGPQRGEALEGPPGRLGPGRDGFRLPPFPLLEALDADQDGKLSASEIDNSVAALKKLDKDGDGKLSQQEIGWPPVGRGFGGRGVFGPGGPGGFPGGPGGRGGPGGPGGRFGGPGSGPGGGAGIVERIMSNDKNEDGKVTREELPEFMQRMLERADTNNDDAIDRKEAEAVAEAFGRGGGFGRGGRGPGRGDAPRPPQRPQRDGDQP